MKECAVVAFSGVSPRVIDLAAAKLSANGIFPAVVKIKDQATDQEYFDRLLAQTLAVTAYKAIQKDVSVTAFLVSGVSDGKVRQMEKNTFFPALRRVSIDSAWRNNPSAANNVANAALGYFQNREEKAFIRSISTQNSAKLLLPLVNSRCKALEENFTAIYMRETANLSHKVNREVALIRGRKCYRIGGIDFAPVENSGQHPIRRCSVTHGCDLKAAFRFGAFIPNRVEFDISCENGLKGKKFFQCDGSELLLNKFSSHLNMRINDDCQPG